MPAVSEAQRKAMCAAAHGHSNLGIPKAIGEEFCAKDATGGMAAGVLLVAPDGDVLLLKRSDAEKNYGGHWGLPGGKADGKEEGYEAATRETREETGFDIGALPGKLIDSVVTPNKLAFHTYAVPVGTKFEPKLLDGEHTEHAWTSLDKLPTPVHPAIFDMLGRRFGTTADMTPDDWAGLKTGFMKWLNEEEAEEQHAQDGAATEANLDDMSKWHGHVRQQAVKARCGGPRICHTCQLEEQLLAKRGTQSTASDALALDRASARSYDQDGHLKVTRTPLTKATVNEYYGREIPRGDQLGLEPNRRYKLLRHPDEIKRAAATWNGKPLLSVHRHVKAADHDSDIVVGSIGTDVEYEHPYLYGSLSVWDGDAIKGIESGSQKELSSSYHYDADMTPGTYEGQAYDGVMRNLRANHVALVRDGRAGSDVVVHDSKPVHWDFSAFRPKYDFSHFA